MHHKMEGMETNPERSGNKSGRDKISFNGLLNPTENDSHVLVINHGKSVNFGSGGAPYEKNMLSGLYVFPSFYSP